MKEIKNILFIAFLSTVVFLLSGCDRNIDKSLSPPIDSSSIPPTPGNLTARVGDGLVILSWSISDTALVSGYRIYIADSLAAQYILIGNSQTQSFTAGNLINGRIYYFRVSSINDGDFEGYKSDPVSALPELYAISINNGEQYSNDANVTLNLTAPPETRFMQISGDSAFSDAEWEMFAASKSFILENGDGLKYVYCRFRDSADRLTWSYFEDSITLDTEAFIESVTFSPSGPFSPGEIVHFYLYTNEPDGDAGITIGANVAEVALFDNGQRGDAVPDDGIYEVDYIIPSTFDFENNYVYGRFIDRAANVASSVVAGDRLTVRRPPDAVTIFSINVPQGEYDRLDLNWERSAAQDFAQYRVYRGTSPGVDSTDFLAASIISISETSLMDTGLVENTAYYYVVYVVDITGLWSVSNEVSATTGADLSPAPVNLYPVIVEPDMYQEIDLEWSQSSENDFESYRLYRWREASGRDDSVLVAFITDRQNTAFTDHPPFDTTLNTINYWYIMHVYDTGGNNSPSDSVRAVLVDNDPPGVSGTVTASDSSLMITWSQSDIPDFNSYRLLRDTDSNPAGAIAVFVTPDRTTVSYEDESTVEGQTYYYWLDIYDLRGNSSRSLLGSEAW
jgi:fibronectin type 3 domain-containing protein